jgi:hypothetical protein
MNLRSLLGRETTIPELQTMVDGLASSAANRRGRARVQMSIVHSILRLISKEATPFEKPTNFALDPYRQIASAEMEFADLEERAKDDLLDIIERHKVIQRTEAQYSDLLNQVQSAKAALVQAELTWATVNSELGPRCQKAEQDLSKAKVIRTALIVKARDLTVQLIEAKQRFYRFRLNRLRHAWITYTDALSKYEKSEAELYGILAKSFGDLMKKLNGSNVSDDTKMGELKDVADGSMSITDISSMKAIAFRNPFDIADDCVPDSRFS